MAETPDWLPTTDQVAQVVARFIPNEDGLPGGQFTWNTVPTDEQVDAIIRDAATDVITLAPTMPEALQPQAQRTVALSAAAQVIWAYFPEADAAAASLDGRYDRSLRIFRDSLNKADPGSSDDITPADVAYSYPDPVCDVIA